jgi:ABC-type phosphate/phosphonate transport system substrate-binding protein
MDNGEVDMIGLTSMNYLKIRDWVFLEPVTVGLRNGGQALEEYLLLVHRDADLSELTELEDKNLLVGLGINHKTALMWLDVLLMQQGLPVAQNMFQTTKKVFKPAQAVFPVFFRQSDACIVTRRAFETMVELNPQIGEQLKPLASSPSFLPDLMCYRQKYDEAAKDLILSSALKLHTKIEGRQMLGLFRVDKIGRFKPSYLDNLIQLIATYDELSAAVEEE